MTESASLHRGTLFFEPLDVLHFRDHRPFDAGLHGHARSEFPKPSVFSGCIRTALLHRAGASFDLPDFGLSSDWAALLGSKDRHGALHVRGPVLATRSGDDIQAFFPRPLDLAINGSEQAEILRPLPLAVKRYHGAEARRCEGLLPWRVSRDKGPQKSSFLDRDQAGAYLDGRAPEGPFNRGDKLFDSELRVGIVRSDKHLTADDHLLYSTKPFRFVEHAGFAVEIVFPATPSTGHALEMLHHAVVPLGGKGHRARIHYVPRALLPQDPPDRPSYKLWLVTPLVLGCDRWPEGISAAGADRPVPVGGFDLAKRAPKPLRSALQAGTVLRIENLTPTEALRSLCGSADASSQGLDDECAGFGVALVAKEACQ